jgi:hypothetical protein
MIHKINKPMFFILLIPFYLLILISFIGISAGSVEWLTFVFYALLMIMAAWGLRRKNSIVINIIGLLLFTGMGMSLIYPALTQTVRVGPWTINIYIGVLLILWGLVAFIYDIVKSKAKREVNT